MTKPLMSWTNQKRWQKRYRGKLYGVSPRTLGQPATKGSSLLHANEWWKAKKAEIDASFGDNEREVKLRSIDLKIDELMVEGGGDLDADAFTKRMRTLWAERESLNPVEEKAMFFVETTVQHRNQTVGYWFDCFMESKTGKVTPGRFNSLRHTTKFFCEFIGLAEPVDRINGKLLLDYHAVLNANAEWAEGYKRDQWRSAKQFIQYVFDCEALTKLPRNFGSRMLTFKVAPKKIKTFDNEELTLALTHADERLQLYILLMLNCGMTQKDIADLKQTEVDWVTGILTRKRSKTGEYEKVPEVSYPLWQKTFELLRKHRSDHAELVLLNANGTALVREVVEGQKVKRSDNIKSAWFRLFKQDELKHINKPPTLLRKTSASRLESHVEHQSVADYFLGHSGSSVAERHYKDTPQERISLAVKWLEGDLGIDKAFN